MKGSEAFRRFFYFQIEAASNMIEIYCIKTIEVR